MNKECVKKALAIAIILVLFSVSVIPSTGMVVEKSTLSFDGKTLYVGGTGPNNYTKIQDAINDASIGDTVFVYSGKYYENVNISKSINLIGENRNTTVIYGNDDENVVTISKDYATLGNFFVQNGIFGIRLCNSKFNIIYNNNISYNTNEGIDLSVSSNNEVLKNTIFSNGGGIRAYSSNNTITDNYIYSNNGDGIDFLSGANDNLIINNTVSSNNYDGISIQLGSRNTLINNSISLNKEEGIYIGYQSNNNLIK